ncbi:nitrogen regulation protein NR(II) [candidate division KSB1 bacterium]
MAESKEKVTGKNTKISKKQKPVNREDISSLIQAFDFFTKNTEKLRESYNNLQVEISALDLELERKKEELYVSKKKIDAIKNHLEHILESMNLAVVVINLEGEISIFNRAASEITGYPAREIIGKPYAEIFGEDNIFENTPGYTLKEGKEKQNKEKSIIAREGLSIPVEFSTSLVRDEKGNVIGAVEIFSDLREIKKLQEEVQQSRTLSALGEMAGNVAHELRNPLGGIGGFAALLERDIEVEDPRRKLVQKIIEGVSRLNRVATNLLVYTRPVRPKKRPEDIIKVVEDILTFVEVELEQEENEIKLERDYSFKSFDINIDPELFQQVMLNIVKNAVQAMEYKGLLKISIVDNKEKEKIEIKINDSGPGIPEEDIKKLFLPFFTTKADGTGLGLSIAKKIVEAHSGEIIVESSNNGTVFSIGFPY